MAVYIAYNHLNTEKKEQIIIIILYSPKKYRCDLPKNNVRKGKRGENPNEAVDKQGEKNTVEGEIIKVLQSFGQSYT